MSYQLINATNFPPPSLAWRIWGLGALLYLVAFYQRVAPAVLTQELMSDFQLNAAALGNLSAFYFYSYVAMQIPTGIIADRWGPRRLLTLGAAIAAVGTLLFALSPSYLIAGIGRFLIGGSTAVAFVGVMIVASRWLAPRYFALASGLSLCFGIVGALFAGVPLRALVTTYGWRPVMLGSALLTLLLSIAIWLVVRDDPAEKGYDSYLSGSSKSAVKISVWQGVKEVLHYRNTWLLFIIPGGIAGSTLTFGGLWGIPFLTMHYQLSTTQAAVVISIFMLAFALGGPSLGLLSDRFGRRKPIYAFTCAVVVVGWFAIIFTPGFSYAVLVAILSAIGFCSGNLIIGFAYAKESVPVYLAGTATGMCNMGVMLGPMLLQPAVGWMLDRNWHGTLNNGVRLYDFHAYQCGFMLMLAWASLALILVMLTCETYCRQTAPGEPA